MYIGQEVPRQMVAFSASLFYATYSMTDPIHTQHSTAQHESAQGSASCSTLNGAKSLKEKKLVKKGI